MNSLDAFFQQVYKDFNDRNIELVIAKMTETVKWANGMDGGYVYGHDGVREYWIRQFTMVSSHVTPQEIDLENRWVRIKVHQVVHDLGGKLLSDEIVYHIFKLIDNKIAEFDIGVKIHPL